MSLLDRAQNATPIVTHPAPRTRIDTAVILAAGEGSRLRLNGDPTPKPLQELLGLTLVERAIRCSRAVGVSRFLVVVGYEADALADALQRVDRKLGVEIETVLNPRWREGNGTSALAAEPYLAADEPFFLMMCDHIFPRAFLQRLAEQDDGASCLLVIDRDVEAVSDLGEATKVELEGGHVRRIGKQIAPFDAVDTGVFLCRSALFDALREASASGEYTIGGAVELLARRGEVSWVPAGGLFWQDIDTPEDLDFARSRLLAERAAVPGVLTS